MKRFFFCCILALIGTSETYSQQRISKKQLQRFQKNLETYPLLSAEDADFKGNNNPAQWAGESAVLLSLKTSFNFDWQGVNEAERRKILLNDQFAIEQYSVLYFRLFGEGDVFAARVIKKDGTLIPVDLAEAISVENVKQVPAIFKAYTDALLPSSSRLVYFKIVVPDLEEGDIIEYEFRNFNNVFNHNLESNFNSVFMEFDPLYYLCNRELPVVKQVIEVILKHEKFFMGYKSFKGAPAFVETTNEKSKTFRWEDIAREKLTDTRYVNEYMELPSIKFQVIFAARKNADFVWFIDLKDMKKDMDIEEFGEKAKAFWFDIEKKKKTAYSSGRWEDVNYESGVIFQSLIRKGLKDVSPDEYVKKVYYLLRTHTVAGNWNDYRFTKMFSNLLERRKIEHQIVMSALNTKSRTGAILFTEELTWLIKYGDKYYSNPGKHYNPEELHGSLIGNEAVVFHYKDEKIKAVSEILPSTDTLDNTLLTQINAHLDEAKVNMVLEKSVEAKGHVKEDVIEDVLTMTPYMEVDYLNSNGKGSVEGVGITETKAAIEKRDNQKNEWKAKKLVMMKELAGNEYDYRVEKYDSFALLEDGRSFNKRNLKYYERFVLADMTMPAGKDLVVPITGLMGLQPRVQKEERNRVFPVDVRYPRALNWKITFAIPAGYVVKGLENLQKKIENACGSFISTAFVEGNTLHVYAKKIYAGHRFETTQWPQMLAILDAAYEISQAKIILKKL